MGNFRIGWHVVSATLGFYRKRQPDAQRLEALALFRELPTTTGRIVIPKVMTIAALADVRKPMQHLPADRRNMSTWRHVATELDKAAHGANVADVALALRLVLHARTGRVPTKLESTIRHAVSAAYCTLGLSTLAN